jgi:hypothetical protein
VRKTTPKMQAAPTKGALSAVNRSTQATKRLSMRKIPKKFTGYNGALLPGNLPVGRVKGNHRHCVAHPFFSLFSKG